MDEGKLEAALMRPQQAAHYEEADLTRQAALLLAGIAQAQATPLTPVFGQSPAYAGPHISARPDEPEATTSGSSSVGMGHAMRARVTAR